MPGNAPKKFLIFGQDPEILKAMLANVISWIVSAFFPTYLSYLLPACPEEDTDYSDGNGSGNDDVTRTRCISIGRPGGLEQLRVITLKEGMMTVGYNLKHFCLPPFTTPIKLDNDNDNGNDNAVPEDCVVMRNQYFSVNYADCTIRWGLYESAKKFVGWPIVPGFDIAGTVEATGTCMGDDNSREQAEAQGDFQVGDQVFGCTLFGAYSNRILVPSRQLRKVPKNISLEEAAALPAVSLTALYALYQAGCFALDGNSKHGSNSNSNSNAAGKFSNKSILIHSAAGGVGSMLCQMSKILGLGPIVGVVGSTSKVEEAKRLGCDVVIDKSKEDLWDRARDVLATHSDLSGFKTVMDANGVSTLQQSYDHLAPTGRVVVFGFHSNLPMGRDMLSPMEWIRMAKKMGSMPAFDPMDLTVENKSVLGFNLSFFADEVEVVSDLFDQVCMWLEKGLLECPRVQTFEGMECIGEAHSLIQSGSSIGKIVIKC
mmetsp:Transcript_2733/g.4004  ORF Transcript_2733/g.4004 Transcript_2733/m.4004 type:complete len:485 (-) Transcript_2733:205-1659(-)|eukprot:CAMPEP_0194119666 /NCGR_PEP_ID=MMETSP0150-20130528/40470_1 /TAXON_ID=122233 /ORGANISM="Chaetoceros debilis, Strain MM31A-1" /LENGTH=484 /DNA_ID=CAMNT_0038811453 /DNA_START=95 /DNA_END=1549 /DNA_ORIENTATION=-